MLDTIETAEAAQIRLARVTKILLEPLTVIERKARLEELHALMEIIKRNGK